MKAKLFSLMLILTVTVSTTSCSSTNETNKNDENRTDSISAMLQMIDSLKTSGTLYHLEYWEIGDFGGYKPITIYVNKLSVETDTLYYVSMEKECSSYYSSSSSYEQAIIAESELKSLRAAIEEIKNNLERETNHGEIYAYCSKSEAMLKGSLYKDGSKPIVKFYVNRRNDNSVVYFDFLEYDLDKFRSLLEDAEDKIKEVKKGQKEKKATTSAPIGWVNKTSK